MNDIPDDPATVFGKRGHDGRWLGVPTREDANQSFVCEAPRDGGVYGRNGRAGLWQPVAGGAVWIGPAPPAAPVQGTLWWCDDPDGSLFIFFDGQWVPASPSGGGGIDPADFVSSAGGTMTGSLSITGNSRLLIQSIFGPGPLGAGTIRLEGGQTTTIQFADPAGMRWQLIESHYDTNEDLILIRGAFPGTISMIASWADGHIALRQPSTMTGDPIGPDDLTRKSYVDNAAAVHGDKVDRGGDTMTGDLRVTNPAESGATSVEIRNRLGNPEIALATSGGAASNIIFNYGGVGWGISVEEALFHIYHSETTGQSVIPFSIERDNHIEMIQPRTVSGDPVDPNDLTRKAYVDQLVTAAPAIIGAIDASTGICRFTTSTGPLPPADSVNPGAYVICDVAGTIPDGPAAGTAMVRGDWLYSDGVSAWHDLNVGSEGAATTAGEVAVIPPVFGQPNVQAALAIAETRVTALEANVARGWNTPNTGFGVAIRSARWRAEPGGIVRWDGCFQLTNFTVSTSYQDVFATGAPVVPGGDGRAFIVPATQFGEAYSFLMRFTGSTAQLRILDGQSYAFVSGTNMLVYLDGVTYLSTSTDVRR
jgi:hypothetical protein